MKKFEWTFESRSRYDERSDLRYPSDLTDREWALIECIIQPVRQDDNRQARNKRSIVNGLMYILSRDCWWTAVPEDLPPRTTLNDYIRRWVYDGTLARIHQRLCGTSGGPRMTAEDATFVLP